MLSENEVFDKLINIVSEVLDEPISITDLSYKLAELGINSMQFIKIVVKIESAFDFEFDTSDLIVGKFATLRNMVAYIQEHSKQ